MTMKAKEFEIVNHRPEKKPFYLEVNDEVQLAMTAYHHQTPVALKGPTGVGKTRFVEYFSWLINEQEKTTRPLVIVPCHADLTVDDLLGRYLMDGTWLDGPMTIAVKQGGILYLDEIAEARPDAITSLHSLTDDRRVLPVPKLGKVYEAQDTFAVFTSFNPGYHLKKNDLKQSTRQRFLHIPFSYPPQDIEERIIRKEAGIDASLAKKVVTIGNHIRNMKGKELEEGASTRILTYAAILIKQGVDAKRAFDVAVFETITDDADRLSKAREGILDVFQNYQW